MREVSLLLAACWEAWTIFASMHTTRADNRCPLRPLGRGSNLSTLHVLLAAMGHQHPTCPPHLYLEFMLKDYETTCSISLWSRFPKSSRCRMLHKTRPRDGLAAIHCYRCTPECLLRCSSQLLSHQPSRSVCTTLLHSEPSLIIQLWPGTDQARFKFAKDAIELRKRGIARGLGAEETVVLAFGGGNFGSSAVHVTRKMRKRPLWKVNS